MLRELMMFRRMAFNFFYTVVEEEAVAYIYL